MAGTISCNLTVLPEDTALQMKDGDITKCKTQAQIFRVYIKCAQLWHSIINADRRQGQNNRPRGWIMWMRMSVDVMMA